MPFLNRSTLTLPATSAFPNGIWEDVRNPTSNDFRNFSIGTEWINFMNKSVWFMVDKTATSGTWVQAAINATGVLDLTGNTGGPVGADLSNNINIIGAGTLSIAGNPGTNTLTVSQNGTVATLYVEDLGSATPSGGVLNILGGSGIATSGAGSTVTITATGAIPLQFTEDAGSAIPSSNNLNIFGGTGINTSGAGSTVTINLDATVATLYTENTGTAAPSGNNLNILGASGILTSGAGSTVTITPGPSIATSYTENTGTATPSGNTLNVLGTSGITTTGAGNTITISPGSTLATLYTENVGTAAPSGNNLNILGGTGISTSGAGSTITINAAGNLATTYNEDAGSATPAANILRIIGGTGISTSGAGNTVTITNTSSSALTFQEDTGTATPAAGVIMIRGGTGISTSGAGSTVTITAIGGGGGITTINGDTGSITGSTVTIFANTAALNCGSSVKFVNSGTTSTLNVTDPLFNTIIGIGSGNAAMASLTSSNISLGYQNFTSASTTAGGGNVAVSGQAFANLTTGNQNCVFSPGGTGSLQYITSGSYNVALGYSTGLNYTSSESSNLVIYNPGVTGDNHVIRIGNNGNGLGQQNACFIAGIAGVTVSSSAAVLINTSTGQLGTISSSRRYKNNIQKLGSERDSIHKLQPVSFTYKAEKDSEKHYGLIAEEVHEVFPELVIYNQEGRPDSVKYHEMTALLLAEIQRLRIEINELKKG